jgi:hypothetical protein
MARIENRSRFSVTVKNRDDLTRTFPYDAREAVAAYIADLKARKLKPKPSRRASARDPLAAAGLCAASAAYGASSRVIRRVVAVARPLSSGPDPFGASPA